MKKLKRISILLLAIGALTATTSCDLTSKPSDTTPTSEGSGTNTTPDTGDTNTPTTGGGDTQTPDQGNTGNPDSGYTGGNTQDTTTKYAVTFETNGGSSVSSQNVESGKTITSVTTTKTGCTFAGWYTDSVFNNSFSVTTPITGNTTLYAKWTATVTFNTNNGSAVTAQTVDCGSAISAVTTSRNGYEFAGWYTDQALSKAFDTTTPITTSITLYAKWTLKTTPGDIITTYAAYNEGAYVVFEVSNETAASNSVVSYSTDSINWTNIDSQLIRYDDNSKTARADILGLKAGSYLIKVNNTEKESTTSTINVSADDRSGYAHFGTTTGVGAYNNDGTLKNNAVVVYVNESNKNTVSAKIGSSTVSGLANILKAQKNSSVPLDIRIIGTVGTAKWNTIDYANVPIDSENVTYFGKTTVTRTEAKAYNIVIKNASGTAITKEMNQSALISDGYNTLDDSYTVLNGLTSKITYSSGVYDSYWNMLDIENANNVTVEGIGIDATIDQWGFTWKKSSSIEVKNLTFNNFPEDACAFQGDKKTVTTGTTSYDISGLAYSNIWVHNNTFNQGKNTWDVSDEQDKHEGDGSTDIKYYKNMTYSYNHYYKNHKTGLVGGGNGDVTANITFHHNWYQQCQSRMPYARQANMHMYNNYYDSSTGTTMQIYAGAYAFVENCYFKNDKKTFELNTKDYQNPAIKSYNNIFDGSQTTSTATIVTSRTQSVSNGNIFNSSFDTDSSAFYYDSTNEKSNVTIMNQASELPTLIPTITGAGVLPNFEIGEFNDVNTDVETFTVNFETNGGTSVSSQTVVSGGTIKSVSTTRNGYTFKGWSTKADLSDSFDVTTPITNTLTLYAKWEQNTSSQTTNTLTLSIPSTTGEQSSNFTAGDFTVTATSGKTVTINSSNIALGGAGSTTYRSIIANVGVTNEITIVINVSGGSNDRYLVVADKDGNSLSETLVTGSTLTIKTSGSTTYYLYSKNKGLNVSSLTITY